MENKYEITLLDMMQQAPHELVAKQSSEEQARTYIALDMLTKALKDEEKQALLKSGKDKFEWTLPNGQIKTLTIIHGTTRQEDVVVKKIDYEAAIKYAKEHELFIPMTEPQVDTTKLENQSWFQENVDKFVVKTIETKTVKSNDTIKVK